MSKQEPLEAFHQEVDQIAGRLEVLHEGRLQCKRGCFDCCCDEITVFEVEAAVIRRHHRALLAQGQAHAEGACAFLDGAGGCRIYAQRPYVCRTQGLPLRWREIADEKEVEHRDICPLNEEGVPLAELPAASCWPIGPAEAKLRGLQEARDESLPRVSLRGLFAASQGDGSGES